MVNINIAARVRHIAESNAISLREVERRAGWPPGRLGMTLKTNNPTVRTLVVLADALGVTVEELIA